MLEENITPLVLVSVPFFASLLALLMAGVLVLKLKRADDGAAEHPRQVEISKEIALGSRAFLKTEYMWTSVYVVLMATFIVIVLQVQSSPGIFYAFSETGGWQTMIAFYVGAVLSALAGWIGMATATQANVKALQAARTGLDPALRVAFAGGAVMGFATVAIGLGGLSILFFIFVASRDDWTNYDAFPQLYQEAARWCSGFGFGASSIALFARVAGGIYTKAADVGADLVAKVQSDIPEDDPRNPATIADNVGDNVGDVAGMGADLFESFVGAIIASITLADNTRQMALPFWIAGFGVLASVVGFCLVRTKEGASQSELLNALHVGVYGASFIVAALSALAVWLLFSGDGFTGFPDNECSFFQLNDLFLQDPATFNCPTCTDPSCITENGGWKLYGCVLIGLTSGIMIGHSTEYMTSYAYAPTLSIARAGAMGGAATVLIQGLGIGMLSTLAPTVIMCAVLVGTFELAGVYGIAIAAVGMLSTLGVTLATDAYGPIADNAGGIAEMTPDCPDEVRARTDQLDALGNTTAATGKGFAIGSAVLTALALIQAFDRAVPVELDLVLTNAIVLAGVVLGAMLPFLFGALTMLSVRKAASAIIEEVQYQFRTIEGLFEGVEGVKPDTERCVTLCTKSSLREMVLPGVVAVMAPLTIGLVPGGNCLGGLLIGSTASGFVLALMMANAGGAWDNAKKYIENEGALGGKGSEVHKAVVVGDTVGDPFKDTSGPALNILIKLMSVMALTLAPIFRGDWDTWWQGLIALGVFGVLAGLGTWIAWDSEKAPHTEDLSPDQAILGKVTESTFDAIEMDTAARESLDGSSVDPPGRSQVADFGEIDQSGDSSSVGAAQPQPATPVPSTKASATKGKKGKR